MRRLATLLVFWVFATTVSGNYVFRPDLTIGRPWALQKTGSDWNLYFPQASDRYECGNCPAQVATTTQTGNWDVAPFFGIVESNAERLRAIYSLGIVPYHEDPQQNRSLVLLSGFDIQFHRFVTSYYMDAPGTELYNGRGLPLLEGLLRPESDGDFSRPHSASAFTAHGGRIYLATRLPLLPGPNGVNPVDTECRIDLYELRNVAKGPLDLHRFPDPLVKVPGRCREVDMRCDTTPSADNKPRCILTMAFLAPKTTEYVATYTVGQLVRENDDTVRFLTKNPRQIADFGPDAVSFVLAEERPGQFVSMGYGNSLKYLYGTLGKGYTKSDCFATATTLRQLEIGDGDVVYQRPLFLRNGLIRSDVNQRQGVDIPRNGECGVRLPLTAEGKGRVGFKIDLTFHHDQQWDQSTWEIVLPGQWPVKMTMNSLIATASKPKRFTVRKASVGPHIRSETTDIDLPAIEKGTVTLLIDNGVIEIFLEEGRYTSTVSMGNTGAQFTEMCIDFIGTGTATVDHRVTTYTKRAAATPPGQVAVRHRRAAPNGARAIVWGAVTAALVVGATQTEFFLTM